MPRKSLGSSLNPTPRTLLVIRRALLQWFSESARPLPWRRQPDVYRTVVSEFMLQQTQVKTVLPYFDRWMERFPDFQSLAAAEEDAVLLAWQGLGYYRRARFLRRLAQAYVQADRPPSTAREWKSYPGVGDYTAAAIASIAHGEPIPVVDGNVARVLLRLSGDQQSFQGGSQAVEYVRVLAGKLLDPDEPGRFNEAMMELGALVCKPGQPDCLACPLKRHCRAFSAGTQENIPRILRPATERVERDLLWVSRGKRILLRRHQASARRLASLWELPLREELPGIHGNPEFFFKRSRGIARQRIVEKIFRIDLSTRGKVSDFGEGFAWFTRDELTDISMSGPHRKWVEAHWS